MVNYIGESLKNIHKYESKMYKIIFYRIKNT